MKSLKLLILVTLVVAFAGCAAVAPPELVNARSAFQDANAGPAPQLAPVALHKAQVALNQAEQSFKQESNSFKTRDLAYVAQRKAEQAGALGAIEADKARKDSANAAFEENQAKLVAQGKQDLSDSQQRNAAAQAELVRQAEIDAAQARADADYQAQQAVIAQGQQDLKESEARTAAAMAELATIASLKEEERGLVLTLSGSILFTFDESTLLEPARLKLEQVAKALEAIRTRNLIVEGHTDSYGSAAYNQALSQRRADAVSAYLVQSGYPANHIQALGHGEGSPIGDNASAEGRANNRRVEIVIQREQVAKQ